MDKEKLSTILFFWTDETETPGGDLKVKLLPNVWEGRCHLAFLGAYADYKKISIADYTLMTSLKVQTVSVCKWYKTQSESIWIESSKTHTTWT